MKRFFAKLLFLNILAIIVLGTSTTVNVHAQETPQVETEFSRAKVIEIKSEGETEIAGKNYPFQELRLKFTTGNLNGNEFNLSHGKQNSILSEQRVKVGQEVVLVKNTLAINGQQEYTIIDKYRLNSIRYLILMFFIIVVFVAGLKGIGSIVGLGLSLLLIVKFIVPQLLEGNNPFWTIVVGAISIITITIFLAHGFTKKTFLALLSTYITLISVVLLALVAVELTSLSGLGAEDAYQLRFSGVSFNFQGLLLGGIIIGTLGILDDVTTAQTALIYELRKANTKINFAKLFKSGMNVGKEHIASLVNTLVLAYAGVSLPLFIFFILNPSNQPTWFIINSEYVAQEIVRAVIGSLGLILAVPISTAIAAAAITKSKADQKV